MVKENVVYRILLLGGPEDGDSLIALNPWYETTTDKGNVYRAGRDAEGQPVMEDGDRGDGVIQGVTQEGEVFSPPVKTIRMTFSHKLQGEELREWEQSREKYRIPERGEGDPGNG